MHDTLSLLAAWNNFYVIVGSSSAALTGLMFVVVTLLPEARIAEAGDGLSTFATPTVVHFCAALFVSAALDAPWPQLWQAAVVVEIAGLAGLVYEVIVLRRARRQTAYAPVFEDWLWHFVLPFAAYGAMTVAGATLTHAPARALFLTGGATALLLFIGIHNAWDTVTYMAIERLQSRTERKGEKPSKGNES